MGTVGGQIQVQLSITRPDGWAGSSSDVRLRLGRHDASLVQLAKVSRVWQNLRGLPRQDSGSRAPDTPEISRAGSCLAKTR
jgi:hypothetical protein